MKKAKRAVGKTRSQIGALPIRWSALGEPEVLLVTTRTTRRWIVPKGWVIKGMKDNDAAAVEAREEAGVIGRIHKKSFGHYVYWKRMADHFVLCKVTLYVLESKRRLEHWQETSQRHSHWFKLADAADLVEEPGLKAVIRKLKARLERSGPPLLAPPERPESVIGTPTLQ
ncbi:NUDIX domain-containing protein [Bosea caraganae]|uniref:NUDIX domain-containing protein n=1 Tax=Bosea caraganae TaxID=2763117 RepID=A0A370LBW1_9HYPH|nr:NUDIX hydrolase [Bosea caraganae]RDJ27446.1 NUDIX domain-containing protein [Bosea caraganae]RDJ29462.1 NUDIX domain-containing protein [Bosea caraganae]